MFQVVRDSPKPLGDQLVEEVSRLIESGRLPEEPPPPVGPSACAARRCQCLHSHDSLPTGCQGIDRGAARVRVFVGASAGRLHASSWDRPRAWTPFWDSRATCSSRSASSCRRVGLPACRVARGRYPLLSAVEVRQERDGFRVGVIAGRPGAARAVGDACGSPTSRWPPSIW